MELRRLWTASLAALILFAALSLQYAPRSELDHTAITTTIAVSTQSETIHQITQSHFGTCPNTCPFITQATAASSLADYRTLVLDIAVFNPSAATVRNVIIRFDYWKPGSCLSSCLPDFTTRIEFDEVSSFVVRSQHLVLQEDVFQIGHGQQFRYNFQIESFVATSISTQTATTLSETHVKDELITVERLVAPYQLVFADGGQSSLIIPSVFAVLAFLAVLGGSFRRPKSSRDIVWLSSDFTGYRDRLQELLFSGEIDEKVYLNRLEEFRQGPKKRGNQTH